MNIPCNASETTRYHDLYRYHDSMTIVIGKCHLQHIGNIYEHKLEYTIKSSVCAIVKTMKFINGINFSTEP